jgi:hypothetical protein
MGWVDAIGTSGRAFVSVQGSAKAVGVPHEALPPLRCLSSAGSPFDARRAAMAHRLARERRKRCQRIDDRLIPHGTSCPAQGRGFREVGSERHAMRVAKPHGIGVHEGRDIPLGGALIWNSVERQRGTLSRSNHRGCSMCSICSIKLKNEREPMPVIHQTLGKRIHRIS